jgi:hypothetical protein
MPVPLGFERFLEWDVAGFRLIAMSRQCPDSLLIFRALQAFVWAPFSFLPFVRGGREG